MLGVIGGSGVYDLGETYDGELIEAETPLAVRAVQCARCGSARRTFSFWPGTELVTCSRPPQFRIAQTFLHSKN